MTFLLINELRKDLATAEERIAHHDKYTEHYRSKHAQLLEAIRILEANEKPKRRIYTIRNNEPLVKLIIPDHEYEAYRRMWPDDAIEVCVEGDEMSYAADSDLEPDYHPSLTKALHPHEFVEVLALLELQSRIELNRKLRMEPHERVFSNRIPRVPYPHPVREYNNLVQPPEWNYVGGTSAIEVAVTKEEE